MSLLRPGRSRLTIGKRHPLQMVWWRRGKRPYIGNCEACRHDWREHAIDGEPCSECRYEIDHQEPGAPVLPCPAQPPREAFDSPQ